MKAYLCKCNNCDSIIIDNNPQINAKKHKLTGEEIKMDKFNCPICKTDDYLTDEIKQEK